ncbi:hypothetical protein OAM67_00595 [bacterium]|nr:hypothetical protein [bacterium]
MWWGCQEIITAFFCELIIIHAPHLYSTRTSTCNQWSFHSASDDDAANDCRAEGNRQGSHLETLREEKGGGERAGEARKQGGGRRALRGGV